MRVLITGAAGFVGSYVARRMVEAGHEAALVLRRQSDPWRIECILRSVTRIEGDLRDLSRQSCEAIASFRPRTVIHLAWAGVGNKCHNDPGQYENLAATHGAISAARAAGAEAFVGLGSQAEYGPCSGAISEGQPTLPTTHYGVAKLAACLLSERLCGQWSMRCAWMRIFSSYGPMDDPNWMIPYLILQLLQQKRPALTAGTQVWDYVHVADAAEAICRVAEDSGATGVFNLGSGQPRPLRSIIEHIRDLIDPSLPLGLGEVPFRPGQVMHLEANIARLRGQTGWSPATALEQGLAQTVQWWRDNRARYGV